MLEGFASEFLRCPKCRCERTLMLHAAGTDGREVREGTLRCSACGAEFIVERGVGQLLPDPPDHVAREAAGLGRFADHMRAQGWDRDKIRQLPTIDDGYWYVQATSIQQLWDTIGFRPGQRLLDIGANTCWASNWFAVRGLQVIALDISLWEMQGLYTADYFIADGTSYFERILGSMNDMPMASGSLDYVYACEVLHHNDSDGLRRTFEEANRILKPGGKLLVINETLKTIKDPVGVHPEAVAQFEGYEHAHWAAQYRWAATRAGFSTRLLEPSYHWFFRYPPAPRKPPVRDWSGRLRHELQSHRMGRKAALAWVNHVQGGASFGMIATKSGPLGVAGSAARAIRDLRPRGVPSD